MSKREWTRLAGAILLQAVKDLDNFESEPEVNDFFNSDWCETLTEIVGMNEVSIRKKVTNDTYKKNVDIRAAYR